MMISNRHSPLHGGRVFDVHIVDDEKRGFEVVFEASLWSLFEVVVFVKFAHWVKDGDLENIVALVDGCFT